MLIDPFVVVAQIINFLILVALLKRFLYKPITQAMETRSQRIERQLATAASKEQDAEAEKELYLQKQQELARQEQEWLDRVKQEAELEKERLTQSAVAEVDLMRSQWYQNFERDRIKLVKEIRDRLSHQVALATRKALSDLANTSLEAQVIEMFIARLYNLDDARLKVIPIAEPHHIITIRSSFIIPDKQRECLGAAVREQIAAEAEVLFEIEKDLICGIELHHGGYKLSWNLKRYLTELEIETAKVLSNRAVNL